MADLDIEEYTTYEEFADAWSVSDSDTRMLWQLLGQLDDDEVLVAIPDWLAEQNTGYVDGATPTAFVGHVAAETEKAVRLADAAAARSLMKLAHRIHNLEQSDADSNRTEWIERQLRKHRRAFEQRADAVTLTEDWLPKSQLLHVVRRA